jgi:hypothetical protein
MRDKCDHGVGKPASAALDPITSYNGTAAIDTRKNATRKRIVPGPMSVCPTSICAIASRVIGAWLLVTIKK